MISPVDYLAFLDEALDGMIEIVTDLGDELANRRLDLPHANTPYALLTHCLGVMDYWGGWVVAGRRIQRDRDGEFQAEGPVVDLVERAHRARRQLEVDLADLDPGASPRRAPDVDDSTLALARTQGGALIHLYEELAQHRGQMESYRDVLLAPWARLG